MDFSFHKVSEGTFSLPLNVQLPKENKDRKQKKQLYYKWQRNPLFISGISNRTHKYDKKRKQEQQQGIPVTD